jgi:hypothetical protein
LLVVVDGTGQAQKNASGPALFIFFWKFLQQQQQHSLSFH